MAQNRKCPSCDKSLQGWEIRRNRFQCANCGQWLSSNHSSALLYGVIAGVSAWLGCFVLTWWLAGNWQKALALGIELGLFGAVVIAVLVYRNLFYMQCDDHVADIPPDSHS